MKIRVFWNDNKFAHILAKEVGASEPIINAQEFFSFVNKSPNSQQFGLIILAELNWSLDGNAVRMQRYVGIKVAQILRSQYDWRGPILFLSFLTRKNLSDNLNTIVNTTGHGFGRLPIKGVRVKELLEKIQPLSPIGLHDIQSFYCGGDRVTKEIIHSFLQDLSNLLLEEASTEDALRFSRNQLIKICKSFGVNPGNYLQDFNSEFGSINPQNYLLVADWVERLGKKLMREFAEKESDPKDSIFIKTKFKILLLDDQDFSSIFIEKLAQAFEEVIIVKSASSAMQVLENDYVLDGQKIMVVVADYRLWEDRNGIKVHQKVQGYQFLKDLSVGKYQVRLVALSGLPRKFLMTSAQKLGLRLSVYSKRDFYWNEEGQNSLIEDLISIGEENWKVIHEQYISAHWNFDTHLGKLYNHLRKSPSYEVVEQYVTEEARFNIARLKAGEEPILRPTKGKFSIKKYLDNKLMSQNPNLGLIFKKGGEEKALFQFAQTLISRRVALWADRFLNFQSFAHLAQRNATLWNEKKVPDRLILGNLLTGEDYSSLKSDGTEYKSEAPYRQYFGYLGLSLGEFPFGLTIEEKRWFQYELGVMIHIEIQEVMGLFVIVEKNLRAFFDEYSDAAEYFKANSSLSFKNEEVSLPFSRDGYLRILTPLHVRAIASILRKFSMVDEENIVRVRMLIRKINKDFPKNGSNYYQARRIRNFFLNHFYDKDFRIFFKNFEKYLLQKIPMLSSTYIVENVSIFESQRGYALNIWEKFRAGEDIYSAVGENEEHEIVQLAIRFFEKWKNHGTIFQSMDFDNFWFELRLIANEDISTKEMIVRGKSITPDERPVTYGIEKQAEETYSEDPEPENARQVALYESISIIWQSLCLGRVGYLENETYSDDLQSFGSKIKSISPKILYSVERVEKTARILQLDSDKLLHACLVYLFDGPYSDTILELGHKGFEFVDDNSGHNEATFRYMLTAHIQG